jgi:DNA (cytosine-5)-methyltransferase 1
MENVADLLVRQNAKGKLYLDLISAAFKRAGYKVDHKVFETERYGVPQTRRRVIFLATKLLDIPITFPEEEPKIATVGEHLAKLKKYAKLSNNEVVENGKFVKVRIKHVPQGGYYEDLPARLKVRKVRNGKLQIVKRYGSYFRRLDWNAPAITVTKNYIIHPKKDRYLTNREKATLHTFPPSYIFEGAQGSVSQQIANAVPPRLAYHIAEHIKKLYEQHELAQSARSSQRNARTTFELRAPKSEGRASRSASANE